MAAITGDFAKSLNTMKTAGDDLDKARNALEDAYAAKTDVDTGSLALLKMRYERASQNFQLLQSVYEVISKIKEQIIQRLGQIGR